MDSPSAPSYRDALAIGHAIYPGVRIGRPGRARTYWPTIWFMRLLRLRLHVRTEGSQHVLPGPAVLIGNHVSAIDPVVAVMSHWWRVTAFTKVEVFEKRGAAFFRLMGQIPLRRGDEDATHWAMDMAARTLARGGKIGLYPEGTRSPDPHQLHRLHKRVMLPLLEAHPDVPVHAISTTYPGSRRGRKAVDVRISARLPLDPRTMTADEIAAIVRDELLRLGGQEYVDRYATDVKRERANGQ